MATERATGARVEIDTVPPTVLEVKFGQALDDEACGGIVLSMKYAGEAKFTARRTGTRLDDMFSMNVSTEDPKKEDKAYLKSVDNKNRTVEGLHTVVLYLVNDSGNVIKKIS